MTSSSWKIESTYDTGFPADSVEWCPIEPYQTYLACGTYLLLEDGEEKNAVQERIGTILIMKIDNKNLELKQKTESNGILDMKWCPKKYDDKIHLAVVTAKGDVNIFCFDGSLTFLTGCCLKEEEGDYMTLAVNWCQGFEFGAKICVTDNKGNAAVLNFVSGVLTIKEKWKAHSLEAWTIAFDVGNSNTIYTGGDDAKLKIWDRSTGKVEQRLVSNRQTTGVTIILPNTEQDNVLLTGSFDEVLHFWDTRNFKAPMYEVKTSGGPWRLKCLRKKILAANIYGGFQIIEFSNMPKVVADFKEHSSLAYGADWCLLGGQEVAKMFEVSDDSFLLGTCSFYDKKLCLSTWDPQKLP